MGVYDRGRREEALRNHTPPPDLGINRTGKRHRVGPAYSGMAFFSNKERTNTENRNWSMTEAENRNYESLQRRNASNCITL